MTPPETHSNYPQHRFILPLDTALCERAPLHEHSDACGKWKEFMTARLEPSSLLWTLSFVRPYSDDRSLRALWDATKYVNRAIWGPRWARKQLGMRATVVAERHRLSRELRGRLHFHVLVEGCPSLTYDRLSDEATRAAEWLQDESGRPMSACDRTDVRAIADEGIASYLTKDMGAWSAERGDSLFFLSPAGVEGAVLERKTSAQLQRLH